MYTQLPQTYICIHVCFKLQVLQEASFNLAPDVRSPSNSVASADSQQPMMNGHVTQFNQSSQV